jgi:hypothetical protein
MIMRYVSQAAPTLQAPGVQEEVRVLWAAAVVVQPLAERVLFHFADGQPASQPDKPEWLYAYMLRSMQQFSGEFG